MKVPKFVYASIALDCALAIGLVYFQPPVSTVMAYGMLVLGFFSIRQLKRWVDKG